MYVKGTNEALRSQGYKFKVGKTYKIDGKLKINENGFHFCDNLDDVLLYYPPPARYFEVIPSENIIHDDDKYCTDEITFVREILLNELDQTGELCYRSAIDKNANVELLQQIVIEQDQTGEWCYWFAANVKNANVERLKKAVIEKDQTGEWCDRFVSLLKMPTHNFFNKQ